MKEDDRYNEWLSGFNFLTYQNKTITQKALAGLVGVDKGYINSILKGRKDAGDRLQDAISRALGFTHDNIRFFGRLLLTGHAPERVGVLVRIFRENKVPSELTPEEMEICEECLGPELAAAGAAWRARMEARTTELARVLSARPNVAQYLGSLVRRSGDAPAPAPVSNVEPATLPERSPRETEFGASAPGPGFAAVPKAAARLSAGGGSFVVEGVSGRYHFRADWLNRLCNPAMAVLFDCVGDSMEPTIRGGETLLVDRSRTEIEDGGIYALGVGDTIMVKRLRRTPDGLVRIISDNRDAYPEGPPARPDEIRILGRVIWHGGEVK